MQKTNNQRHTGGGKSLCSNWKAFYFTEVFTEIQRGKRLKKPTMRKVILPMYHQHPSITVLTDLLVMMAA